EKRAQLVDRLREGLVGANEIDVEERLSRAPRAMGCPTTMIREDVERDVDARAIEATRVEGQRLEPEMPSSVAVDAEHRGTAGLAVSPPPKDSGRGHAGVARLREDRREVGRVRHFEELAVVQVGTSMDARAQRLGGRVEAVRL